jgi:hypothetical protein
MFWPFCGKAHGLPFVGTQLSEVFMFGLTAGVVCPAKTLALAVCGETSPRCCAPDGKASAAKRATPAKIF